MQIATLFLACMQQAIRSDIVSGLVTKPCCMVGRTVLLQRTVMLREKVRRTHSPSSACADNLRIHNTRLDYSGLNRAANPSLEAAGRNAALSLERAAFFNATRLNGKVTVSGSLNLLRYSLRA